MTTFPRTQQKRYILIFLEFFVLNSNEMKMAKRGRPRKNKPNNLRGSEDKFWTNVVKGLMSLEGSISAEANHKTGEVIFNSSEYNPPSSSAASTVIVNVDNPPGGTDSVVGVTLNHAARISIGTDNSL